MQNDLIAQAREVIADLQRWPPETHPEGVAAILTALVERNYQTFTDGMEAAAEICGSLAETTYDDTDAFEAATGCEAAIMAVVKQQRKEQRDVALQEKPDAG